MDVHAERGFRNEQRRHQAAVTRTVDSIAEQAARIKESVARGESVAHELRGLLTDVARAFERATAYEALAELGWIFDAKPES